MVEANRLGLVIDNKDARYWKQPIAAEFALAWVPYQQREYVCNDWHIYLQAICHTLCDSVTHAQRLYSRTAYDPLQFARWAETIMQHQRVKATGTAQNPHVNGAWVYKMICEAEVHEGLRPWEAVPRTHTDARSGATPAPAEEMRTGKPSSEEQKRLWQARRDIAVAIC